MEYRKLHPWVTELQAAADIQRSLQKQISKKRLNRAPQTIAGVDVSSDKFSDELFAAIVVLEAGTMRVLATATAITRTAFPYIPGFLSFREIPALIEAWEKLNIKPDVVIVDGQGIAHPRRVGIASHLGLLIDCPTIGCAKNILVGHHGKLANARGSMSPLIDKDETIGMALRTRRNVRPVYVSIGNRIDLDSAVSIILASAPRFRLPEPIRQAHALSNQVRSAFREGVDKAS